MYLRLTKFTFSEISAKYQGNSIPRKHLLKVCLSSNNILFSRVDKENTSPTANSPSLQV